MELAVGCFVIGLFFYVGTVKAIWQLVTESRELQSGVHFNHFWWTPAWKVHRTGYPASPVRRQIVTRFLLTFACMVAVMVCLAYSTIHPGLGARSVSDNAPPSPITE